MKKSHPVRRAVLATAATVSGIVLLLTLKPASDPGSASAAGDRPPVAGGQSPQGGAQAAGADSASGSGSGSGQDAGTRTVTGSVVRTEYGPVQVRLTVSGGRVTEAAAVQSPSGGRSTDINADAVPRLNRAAVAAQSAQIDAVSGATYTSTGYRQSLQSALDQVRADGPAKEPAEPSAPAAPATQVLTGGVARTEYGPVQVRITVAGGRIIQAETLQAPSGGRSTQITENAVPALNRAAVAAGDAQIDAVSGATYTSAGYQESLQSALDRAGG
ncbi:FMN-binding protein [Streptomyces sp. NPDC091377]|uniref:FMN-binding protein n=1 Tax=Streptomyces sp. NPDC091377 TaxID=3365995 RepID=UPI00382E7C1F